MNILFITKGSFGSNDATGAMLNNIFGGLTNYNVLQFSLKPIDKVKISPISIVSEIPKIEYSIYYKLIGYLDRKVKNKYLNKVWKELRSFLIFLNGITPPILLNRELEYIDTFKPEVIYTLGADIKVLRVCRFLAKRCNIPIVIHNMDDYYGMDYKSINLVRRLNNYILRKEYQQTYKYSKKSLAIGPKMATEYTNIFGLPFDWVMNCVKRNHLTYRSPLNDGISTIIFSGGLHGGRASTLEAIANYIEGIEKINLEIYTGLNDLKKYQKSFEKFKKSNIFEYVPKNNMFANLSRADILLHVESFEPRNLKYFRLSMSTKIPEYMVTGRPILCIGSLNIATVDYIKSNEIGHVISNVSEIDTALSLMENKSYRVHLVKKALSLAYKTFDQSSMQKKLTEVLEYNVYPKSDVISNK